MTATAATFEEIARYVFDSGTDNVPLESALKAISLFSLNCEARVLKAEMASRGISYANGELTIIGPKDRAPRRPTLKPFAERAKLALEMATRPIPAADLIFMSGLTTEALPASGLAQSMRSIGAFHIPGLGYWRHTQYADSNGRLFFRPHFSDKANRLLVCFREFGWPLSGRFIEDATGGEIKDRYCSSSSLTQSKPVVRMVYRSLFVPSGVDNAKYLPFPMTKRIASLLLEADGREQISSGDDNFVFKLCRMMEYFDMGEVRLYAKRSPLGKTQRYCRINLSQLTIRLLENIDKRDTSDEF